MASFTDEVSKQSGTPNFTGVSQGTGTDRSFEALFSGLSETVTNVAQIKDTATQLDIQDEADQMFQQTNQEFGVDAPPPGLQDGVDRMATLQAAFDQGKINETNYYGRLATLSKQMRSKHPGYEKIVDSTIQSVTGTRPANAYRDALFSEIKSLQEGASDEVRFRRQYEKENEGEIAAVLGDDYFNDPNKYDFNEVRSKVSGFKGKRELIDSENKELELMSKRGEFNDKRAKKAVDADFTFIADSIMNRALKLNQKGAMGTINEFIAKGGGSGEETKQFIAQVSELETTTRAELLKRGREQYVAKGLISNEELNNSIDEALYPITKAKEAVLGGDFKLASKYATLNKIATDQQVDQMLNADPRFKAGKGLEEISGTLAETFWGPHQDELSTIAVEIAGQAAAGRTTAISDAVKTGNDKVVKRTLETSLDVIRAPETTPEQINNIADQFFGPNATKWMDPTIVAPDDRERLYKTFLNPQVTKTIFEKGSDEVKQNYLEWAVTQAPSIVAFKAAAGDVNTFKGMDAVISLDPKTNRLVLTSKDSPIKAPGIAKGAIAGLRGAVNYQSRRALKSFNEVLSVLEPIADAAGIDKNVFAKSIIQQMGVQLQDVNFKEGSANEGFWGSAYDAYKNAPKEGEGGRQSSSVDEGTSQPDVELTKYEPIDLGDFDILTEQEDKVITEAMQNDFSAGEGRSIGTENYMKLPSRQKANVIRDGLIDRGLPEHVAEAFVINMRDESGLNPGINEKRPLVKGSRGGFGLYQLTGIRRRAYEKYAKRRGLELDSIDAQLDFLITELKGKEAKAFRTIMTKDTRGEAAAEIVREFLRPARSHRNSRANRYIRMG